MVNHNYTNYVVILIAQWLVLCLSSGSFGVWIPGFFSVLLQFTYFIFYYVLLGNQILLACLMLTILFSKLCEAHQSALGLCCDVFTKLLWIFGLRLDSQFQLVAEAVAELVSAIGRIGETSKIDRNRYLNNN